MSLSLLKACFGTRDRAGADTHGCTHRRFDDLQEASKASSKPPGPSHSNSPPSQPAASCNASLPHHPHQTCCSSSTGAGPPPSAAKRGSVADSSAAPQPCISRVPSSAAPAPRLRPSAHPGLNAYATQHSPCVITALTMDGARVFQNPMSIRYFGDLSKRDWPTGAATDNGPQSGLPMGLLRSLFSLEGEQQLQEMLAGFPGQRPAAGDADADAEPFSWCRVMRVPLDCRPHGPARNPSARRALCSSPSVGARREAAPASPQPPARTSLLRPSGHNHVPRVHSVDGFWDMQCGVSSVSTVLSFAEVTEELPEAEMGLDRQMTYSPNSGGNIVSSSNVVVEGEASAMSVAVRNAPPRMLSLLTLSMASKSCPVPATDADAGAPLAKATPGPGSCKDQSPDFHSLSEDPAISSLPMRSTPVPRTKQLAHEGGSCSQLQLGVGVGVGPSASSPLTPLLLTPSASLRQPPGVLQASPSRGRQSGPWETGSGGGAVDKSGDLMDLLLGGTAPGELEAPHLAPMAVAEEGADPAGAEAIAAAAAAPGPRYRLRDVRRTQAQAQARLSDVPEAGSERTEGSGGSGGDGVGEATMQELGPSDYCWHEVFVTSSWDEDGSQVLLIYQTNVTVRTHLETILAELADMQLETLCQIFPRHVIESMAKRTPASPLHTPDLGHLARSHDDVFILFMDIVGFTSMSKQVSPHLVMTFLNSLFSIFDNLCSVHEVFKVETAGDCYIVSSGLMSLDAEGFNQVKQSHDPEDSATRVLAFAIDMLAASRKVLMPHDGSPVSIRIGVHTGPCVSGIVGNKMPKFCVFGDTMNTASRMESTCTPGRIQISSATHALLVSGGADHDEWEGTGGIAVKGKGVMETFLWVESQQGLGSLPLVPSIGDDLAAALTRSSLFQENVQCSLSAPGTPALAAHLPDSEGGEGDAAAPAQRRVVIAAHPRFFGKAGKGLDGIPEAGQPAVMDLVRSRSSIRRRPAPASPARRPPPRQKSVGFSLQAVGQLMSLMHQTSKLEAPCSSSSADVLDVGRRRSSADGSVVLPSPYVSILEAFRTCEQVDPLKVRRCEVLSDLMLKAGNEQERGGGKPTSSSILNPP